MYGVSSSARVGILNSDFSSGSPTVIAFNRGGTWDNGPNSGAFTLNLDNTPSDSNPNIGFRAALAYLITPDDSRRLLQEWLPSAHGIRYYSPVVNHYLVGDKYSKEVCDFP